MTWSPEGKRARVRRLTLTVAAAVGACLAVNAVVFCLGWDTDAAPGAMLPPGRVIGLVWVGLFVLLGVARWRLAEAGTAGGDNARRRVDILLLNCALYPFYTLGLSSMALGLAGNIVTLGLAGWALRGAARVSRLAAVLILPIVPCVLFATVGVVEELRGQG